VAASRRDGVKKHLGHSGGRQLNQRVEAVWRAFDEHGFAWSGIDAAELEQRLAYFRRPAGDGVSAIAFARRNGWLVATVPVEWC